MSLKDAIAEDMKSAMREKNTIKLETIRLLRSAIQRKEVDEQTELDDEAVLQIVQKMVKQCRDAAEQFTQGGRDDLASKEKENINILKTYLPAPLSAEEIDKVISTAIAETSASSMKDMGKVMGSVKSKIQGRADMAEVSSRIKALLS